MQKCKNRSLVENLELFDKLDDSYPSDPMNVLTIQYGITFLNSLMSLVTTTQPKFLKYYTPDTINLIFKQKVEKQ